MKRKPAASSPPAAFATKIAYSRSWISAHRAVGNCDADANLWPQPLVQAPAKDQMEREVCWRVCRPGTMKLEDAVALVTDWHAGYSIVFGDPPVARAGR
jgi:hypothetical protein